MISYFIRFDDPDAESKVGLYPLLTNEQRCPPLHSWGAGIRNHFIIHYVISGKGKYYCSDREYPVEAGEAFVIFPYTVVKYCADAEDPWHYIWVAFTGAEAEGLFSKLGVSGDEPLIRPEDGKGIAALIRAMPRDRSSDLGENLLFTSKLYELFSMFSINKEREEKEHPYYRDAVRYMKNHYYEPITVDEVSKAVGVSRTYLFSLFKKACGRSPKEILMELRMEKAGFLLKSTELNIGFISNSVGYSDPLLFSKMFKKYYGASPKAFRETEIGK